jgi:hypothetical protein
MPMAQDEAKLRIKYLTLLLPPTFTSTATRLTAICLCAYFVYLDL